MNYLQKYNTIVSLIFFFSIFSMSILFSPLVASAEYAWTYQTNGSETSDNWFITASTNFVDQNGNSYLTGVMFAPGSVDFNGSADGGILTLEEGSDPYPYILKVDKNGLFQWVKKINNVLSGTTNYSYINSISIDRSGNSIYMVGVFNGLIDFDPENEGGELTTSSGKFSNFVLKISSGGDFQWAKKIGDEADSKNFIYTDIDSSGNMYVTGTFTGNVDFDLEKEGGELTSSADTIFVLKLKTEGGFDWVKALKSLESPQKTSSPSYLKIDNSGNILISGIVGGKTDIDLGGGTSFIGESHTRLNFVLKLNNNGELIWVKTINLVDESDYNNNISINYLGNSFDGNKLYISGAFSSSMYIDGENQSSLTSNNFSNDGFIYKMDNITGDYIWGKSFGSSERDTIDTMTIDGLENLYASGTFKTSIDFDPENEGGELTTSSLIEIPYILKLNKDGLFEWAKKIDGSGLTVDDYIYPYFIDNDIENNLYLSGYFSGKPVEGKKYDFNPGFSDERTDIMTSYATEDSFLIKINADATIEIPSISIPSASDINKTSAIIHGSITDNGGEDPSPVGFQYGLDSSYGSAVISNNTGGSFSYDFSGSLSCNTSYHFRAYAENSAGVKYSEDQTFTTEECSTKSRVTGSSASAIAKFFSQQIITKPILTTEPATTTTHSLGTTPIKLGQRNTFVKELQKFLNINLKLNLIEDGIFGQKTKTAVISFQKANGLTPDGIVGPMTKGKIK